MAKNELFDHPLGQIGHLISLSTSQSHSTMIFLQLYGLTILQTQGQLRSEFNRSDRKW